MASPHVSLAPEALFHIGPLEVTNSMLTATIVTAFLCVAMVVAVRRLKLVPAGGVGGALEAVSEAVLSQAEQVFGTRQAALRYFPLLATLFLFILLNNWAGLIPGLSAVTLHGAPLFRSVTADLNTTIALALISVVLTQVYAIRQLGVAQNLKRYFHSWAPGTIILGMLEVVLELTRVISFSFRLFGNIFAGEVLLIVIASLVPIIGPSPFWAMEIFVGFIQALVFTMLTMAFIAMAITPPAHAEHQRQM